jgi:hypothetical protein
MEEVLLVRARRRFSMHRAVLSGPGAIICIGLLAVSGPAYADSITNVQVRTDVLCVATEGFTSSLPRRPDGCLIATPGPIANASANWDAANDVWRIAGTASGTTAIGANEGTIDLIQQAISTLSPASWALGFTYSLDVLSPDGTWTDILQTSLDDSGMVIFDPVSTVLAGHFDFASGAPYEIRSLLSVFGVGIGGVRGDTLHAIAVSEWTDVFTFTGDPSVGANFIVSLNGVLFAEQSFLADGIVGPCRPDRFRGDVSCGPTYVGHSRVDFDVALTTIDLQHGARVQSASGTKYPVSVPEPEPVILFIMGLACLPVRQKAYRRLVCESAAVTAHPELMKVLGDPAHLPLGDSAAPSHGPSHSPPR